jgi:predicted dinucleotide-binding enzyme
VIGLAALRAIKMSIQVLEKVMAGRIPLWCLLIIAAVFASTAFASDKETIAIIGTGDLGDSFGVRFAELGYTIVYGSRNPDSEKAQRVVSETGHGATVTTQVEAARQGDIVFLALPWPAMSTVAKNLGDLSGKIVVDPSIPWTQGEDGYPASQADPSSAELIQRWNPKAHVVKGIGTMGSMIIDRPSAVDGPVTIPLASDHRAAKERVAGLVMELGLDPVDFGPLRMGQYIDALQLIYMIPLLQQAEEEWEFYFRRNADWVCQWQDDWSAPVYDKGNLAVMPETQSPPTPCSTEE